MKGKVAGKRFLAMILSFAMVLTGSVFSTVETKASFTGDPSDPNVKQYGLWMGDSWFEDQGNTRTWCVRDAQDIKTIPFADAEVTNGEYIRNRLGDYRDVDLREVDGENDDDKLFYFVYIDYTKSDEGISTKGNPVQITDAKDLVISYLGEELDHTGQQNYDDDARWAKDSRQDTDATITKVGDDGLFSIQVSQPGYYIISKGELISGKYGDFENSDAAIHFHVYQYTGLGVRDADYDERPDQFVLDQNRGYRNEFGCNLWGRAVKITDILNGQESPVALDDLEVTYYGFPTDVDGNEADPRYTYETVTHIGRLMLLSKKYPERKETNAQLQVYEKDENLFYFTPDQAGVYLISKKGITDDPDDEDNLNLRSQAIRINVNNDDAAFFKAPYLTGANLCSTRYGNTYDTSYFRRDTTEKELFVYLPPIHKTIYTNTFEDCTVWYGEGNDNRHHATVSENGVLVFDEGEDLPDNISIVPVGDGEMTGWYRITYNSLDYGLYMDFISNYNGGRSAYLNVELYEDGTYYVEKANEYGRWESAEGTVTEPLTFRLWKADAVSGNTIPVPDDELDTLKAYIIRDLGIWNGDPDNPQFDYFDWVKADNSPYYDINQHQWSFGEGQIPYPNATNPTEVLEEVGTDIVECRPSEEKPGWLEFYTQYEGRYAVCTEAGGRVDIGQYLPGIGLYTTPERKQEGMIDNLVLSDKVYQGIGETRYVLAYTDYREAKDNPDPWSTIALTLSAKAIEGVWWNDQEGKEEYDEIEGFVSLDKKAAVKNADGNLIGYAITFSDKIDKSFTLRLNGRRLGSDIDENWDARNTFEQNDIEIQFVALKEIKVTAAPNKSTYEEGAKFESAGLKVEAVYDDGKTVSLNPSDYTISISGGKADKSLAVSDKAVTITYFGKTTSTPITVTAKAEQKTDDKKDDQKETQKEEPKADPKPQQEAPAPAKVGETVKDSAAPAGTDSTFKVTQAAAGTANGKVAYTGEGANSTATAVTVGGTITGADGSKYDVTEVADGALKDNATIKKLTFADTVETVGADACKGMKALESVTLGKNVTTVKKNSFANDKKLKSFKGGAALTSIEAGAFSGDAALKTLDLSKSPIKTFGKNFLKGAKPKTIKVNVNNLKKVGKKLTGFTAKNKIVLYAKDQKTYKNAVKKFKSAGAKKAKYSMKKAKK